MMSLNKIARNGKSQSAALYLGTRYTEISLKDAFMIARVYASSEILYIQPHVVLVLLQGSDNHPVVFRRISYGIAKQISQHPCYFLAIDIELAYFLLWVIHLYIDMELVCLYLVGLNGIINQLYWLCDMGLQLQRPALYLCHVEQFARNA